MIRSRRVLLLFERHFKILSGAEGLGKAFFSNFRGKNADKGIGCAAIENGDVRVHPTAVIESGARIGKGCTIGAGSFLAADVVIGENTHIAEGVTLQNCTVGSHVCFKPGARIGQDGFGYHVDTGPELLHEKKPQIFRVIVEDNVEIGANCTVDRGSWRDTVIGKGTKIDNMVHIAHNVRIGTGCLIAAQCGIAGSTNIGDGCLIGGQTGVAQHLTVGDRVSIAAKSGVLNDLAGNKEYGGVPAIPLRSFLLHCAEVRRNARA